MTLTLGQVGQIWTGRREGENFNYINGSQLHTEVNKRFVPFVRYL